MNVEEAILTRRTIRKFKDEPVDRSAIERLIRCGGYSAFGANLQPLKFKIINDKDLCDAIFPYTKWAGCLKDGTPKEGERPPVYIAMVGDLTIKPNGAFECDAGAAMTSIMLCAVELGLATCALGAINREKISEILGLAEDKKLLYLIALGLGAQKSEAEDMTDSVEYYEDENGKIHVPKRRLEDTII